MGTQRLTVAQALVRHLAALRVEQSDGSLLPYVGGVFGIFGHGNVAGLGEALWAGRAELPTYRAHNEQGMAHAAIAYAKAHMRRRIMAVTTSIGPGATNLVTAAALAHVNRLPVLLLPGDVFASRAPDPVLQQVEDFHQGDLSANDCFRPVTRYFDRLMRPEQLLTALPRAVQVMTDPALCGPACLALPQDVQAEAFDCPDDFLHPEPLRLRRPEPDQDELARAAELLRSARRPFVVAGGGVLYSEAGAALREFCERHGVPVAETQAGKSSLSWDHPMNLGAIGVTGSPAANTLARDADLVLAVGSRLQDFTTGSHALFAQARLLSLNVQPVDAAKWGGRSLVCDARVGLQRLSRACEGWRADAGWTDRAATAAAAWRDRVAELTTAAPRGQELPYDAEVIGAVRDSAADSPTQDVVVCAAGTLPAELHKLWRAAGPGNYHMEYGYSCMGYEIAGGLGVKMARPQQEVIVMVGDGSYLMMNSEIATSVMLGRKLIVVVLDNRGYGCIHRLQRASGGARFNNLLDDCVPEGGEPAQIDFAMHARSLGADAEHVADVAALKAAMVRARASSRTTVLVIDTTPERTTADGGCWWEVALPEVSQRAEVATARQEYRVNKQQQRV
ncbi:3D-(3,5/4)-trihydroxycyclohexane-1,2-dione acylhydrolase (decyclizing) [Eleftheria terrae]|uniref:3D-(3,5/4)-trihydroxycyclohexane-1,2-dione acylhydrolase (decyclizing) n=1 Tax=Eleftheria terrae TaxID=1597781 RepID=UPI00263B4D38|nr:3D-(3,5/4)-trihydroxycyclohexane-1,2-dione acylhydrolase (decyclizing) [Eleftheria terrae]WKB51290.1 3D-(3,5/4)-trihydroxycyclohexane-1,2-dione acylhydrolase (decyclizing) [Eleftheria terrae]